MLRHHKLSENNYGRHLYQQAGWLCSALYVMDDSFIAGPQVRYFPPRRDTSTRRATTNKNLQQFVLNEASTGSILAATIIVQLLSAAVVFARAYSRAYISRTWALDDTILNIAWVSKDENTPPKHANSTPPASRPQTVLYAILMRE